MFACDECGSRFASVIQSRAHGLNSCRALSLPANQSVATPFAVANSPASHLPFVNLSHDDDFVVGVGAYFDVIFNSLFLSVYVRGNRQRWRRCR